MRPRRPTSLPPSLSPSKPHPTASRRSVLQGAASAALGAALTSVGLPLRPLRAAQEDAAARRPQVGDLLVRAADAGATPLRVADLVAGPPVPAWAVDPKERVVRNGSRFNQVLLLKLDPSTLDADTRARSAEGVVAYTIICPHSGCDVGDWTAADQTLLCACHSSVFDPKRGARVVDGPAPRSLPALPLGVADGLLVVAGGFTDKVGFEAA